MNNAPLSNLLQRLLLPILGGSLLMLSACSDITNTPGASNMDDEGYSYVSVEEDPLEGFNRGAFATHKFIDQNIVSPVAQAYNYVVPQEGRDVVSNILDNLAAPVSFVNAVLQGDAETSFATFWRFMLNSTLGFAGAYDFAKEEVGLTAREADFGQTLAYYGANSGPYLFLPVFGPTTLRDGTGRGVDLLFNPVTWAEGNKWSIVQGVAKGLTFRSENMRTIDDIYNNSIDPYATMRSAYLQRRASELREWTTDWSW